MIRRPVHTLRDLRNRTGRARLTADFTAYLDGFSPNVQEILDNFEFRNQIPRLSRADALGSLIHNDKPKAVFFHTLEKGDWGRPRSSAATCARGSSS